MFQGVAGVPDAETRLLDTREQGREARERIEPVAHAPRATRRDRPRPHPGKASSSRSAGWLLGSAVGRSWFHLAGGVDGAGRLAVHGSTLIAQQRREASLTGRLCRSRSRAARPAAQRFRPRLSGTTGELAVRPLYTAVGGAGCPGVGDQLPSMQAKRLRALLTKLCGPPLRQKGSHARYAPLRGDVEFTFSKHDNEEVSSGLVRTILVDDAGLTPEEAARAIRKGKL